MARQGFSGGGGGEPAGRGARGAEPELDDDRGPPRTDDDIPF